MRLVPIHPNVEASGRLLAVARKGAGAHVIAVLIPHLLGDDGDLLGLERVDDGGDAGGRVFLLELVWSEDGFGHLRM